MMILVTGTCSGHQHHAWDTCAAKCKETWSSCRLQDAVGTRRGVRLRRADRAPAVSGRSKKQNRGGLTVSWTNEAQVDKMWQAEEAVWQVSDPRTVPLDVYLHVSIQARQAAEVGEHAELVGRACTFASTCMSCSPGSERSAGSVSPEAE